MCFDRYYRIFLSYLSTPTTAIAKMELVFTEPPAARPSGWRRVSKAWLMLPLCKCCQYQCCHSQIGNWIWQWQHFHIDNIHSSPPLTPARASASRTAFGWEIRVRLSYLTAIFSLTNVSQFAVLDVGQARRSRGVPVKTTSPPSEPPPDPMSMTQSACAISSSLLSLCQLEVAFVAVERTGTGEAADFG